MSQPSTVLITLSRRAMLIAGAVASVALPGVVSAQTEYRVSTSGATALGAFTRMNGNANSPTTALITRGTLAIGTNFTIGNTAYTVPVSGVQYFGISNPASPIGSEPSTSVDRVSYLYRESGSIQGILDTADSGGLLIANGNNPTRPGDPRANLFVWYTGSRFNSVSSGYTLGAPNLQNSFPNTSPILDPTRRQLGRNYNPTTGAAETVQNGQDLVRIGWSDVKFQQGFSVGTTGANPGATPTTAGYGLGQGTIGTTNFQALRNASAITGGTADATTRLRNEDVAVVGFNLVANPGTGLAEVSKDQAKWLQAVGRLPNGADFNSITREIGSGTRNQGANNLGLDASWGGGERDRLSTNTAAIVGGTNIGIGQRPDVTDNDGVFVTIQPGGEMKPELSLTGSTTQTINENRVGPQARFSDKISGSSGVRATVVASRMGLGILSAGDSRDNTNGSALDSVKTSTGSPMRALRIDFDNNGPNTGVQGTAANITSGAYEMWSSAQAVTVAPYANPNSVELQYLDANSKPTSVNTGTPNPSYNAALAYRPINGDQNDQSANPTSTAQPGLHRKFLDNITRSVVTFDAGNNAITPGAFIVSQSFIPPQIMAVTKEFDGSAQQPRTRSVSEQALYDSQIPNGTLGQQTNWGDPSATNGGLATQAVKYRIFATENGASNAVANRIIDVTDRTNLAGDFSGDNVRDLNDVAAAALAFASPTAYLATPVSGDANGRNYNGTQVSVALAGPNIALSTGTNASTQDGLIVLSDFNSNGNVTTDANTGFATTAVERADIGFFLWGATVDTGAASSDVNVNKDKRENLVRSGNLKKNSAIGTFNTTLDTFTTGATAVLNPTTGLTYTQNEINQLKFEKRDVDGSGTRAFAGVSSGNDFNFLTDALLVDKFNGKSYTNFDDQAVAFAPQPHKLSNGTTIMVDRPLNLVRVELDDSTFTTGPNAGKADGLVTQLDMDVMNEGLTTTAGVNPTGRIDHSWAATSTKTGSLNIVLKPATGTYTVPTNASFTVGAGTFEAGGNANPFVDNTGTGTNGNKLNLVTNTGATFKASGGSKTIGTLSGTGNTLVTGSGTTLLANHIRQSTLTIDAGATAIVASNGGNTGVSRVGTLSLLGSSVLDLNNNDIIFDYTGVSPIVGLQQLVNDGVNGSAGVPKIVTDPTLSGFSARLALVESSDTSFTSWKGQSLDSTSIIGAFTYLGDANLDGGVDALDFDVWLTNLGSNGGWYKGDFTGDGLVDSLDFDDWFTNLGASGPSSGLGLNLASLFADEGIETYQQVAAYFAAHPVPEPGSLLVLALAGAGTLLRPRRRNSR